MNSIDKAREKLRQDFENKEPNRYEFGIKALIFNEKEVLVDYIIELETKLIAKKEKIKGIIENVYSGIVDFEGYKEEILSQIDKEK